MIILLVIAVVVVGAPLVAIGAISIAVFREESMHSLIGRAPGSLANGTRRLLGFHSEAVCEPISLADAWREGALSVGPLFGDGGTLADGPLFADEPIAAGGGSLWRNGR